MARTILIGDVHGCADEFDDLLRAANHSADDRIVLVGDLVAKGPDSLGVVQRARELRALAVLGNHDERCAQHLRAGDSGEPLGKPLSRHHATVCSELERDESSFRWLAELPTMLDLPEFGVLVVHAALDRRRSLASQRRKDLLHGRSVRPDGTLTSRAQEGVPWASEWRGPQRVVFGHDAIRGLQQHRFATGLDTGCVYGGRLTALLLPEDRLVSVPARRAYKSIP